VKTVVTAKKAIWEGEVFARETRALSGFRRRVRCRVRRWTFLFGTACNDQKGKQDIRGSGSKAGERPQEISLHFKVEYDTGEIAEVSWSFIREFPPKNSKK
jgi:hypothetical protein